MLIIYRKSDGQVMDNTGINSMFPEGVPNHEEVIDNVVVSHGGTREDYSFIRLHDSKDSEIVSKTFTHNCKVENGSILFGDARTIPEELPQPPSEIDILREQVARGNAELLEAISLMLGGV